MARARRGPWIPRVPPTQGPDQPKKHDSRSETGRRPCDARAKKKKKRPAGLGGPGVFGFSARPRALFPSLSPQSPRRPAPACYHPAFHARRYVRALALFVSTQFGIRTSVARGPVGGRRRTARFAAKVGSLCSGVLAAQFSAHGTCGCVYTAMRALLGEGTFSLLPVSVIATARVVGLERLH